MSDRLTEAYAAFLTGCAERLTRWADYLLRAADRRRSHARQLLLDLDR